MVDTAHMHERTKTGNNATWDFHREAQFPPIPATNDKTRQGLLAGS